VDNGNGEPISTLSYSEYLEVVACVIRNILCAAYQATSGNLPERVKNAEHLALIDIMHRGVPDEFPGVEALEGLCQSDSEFYEPPVNQVWLNWTIALVRQLARRFAIVARVNSDSQGNFVVQYAETVIPPLLVSEGTTPFARIKGMARILLGARPVNLLMSLHAAGTCQSYHLYVHSDETLYLGSQEAPDLKPYFDTYGGKENTIPPYYRFQSRLGQSYAHFYARYFPPTPVGSVPLTIQFRFYEKPPGSVFRAVIAGVASFLLIWLVGYVSTHTADPKTDAPAFLLVVPALAAAFLGFDASGRRLMEGTLVARLSLIITAIVSLGASGLYLVDWTQMKILQHHLSDNSVKILYLDRTAWCVLLVIALFNALYVVFTYLIRSWEFTHLASRRSMEELEKIE
jgi:hypothetical protein